MRNYKFTFMVICCAAAMTACGKIENSEPTPGPEPAPESNVVLYGSFGEVAKTYLSSQNNEETFDVRWENGDEIATRTIGGNSAIYVTHEVKGGKKARFEFKADSGTELGSSDEFDAFYPASMVNGSSFQWPSEQRYKVYTSATDTLAGAAGNNPMWAHAKLQDNRAEMQFYNLGGVIRFKLSQPAENFNVVMAMISADEPLSGPFTLDETPGSPIVSMDENLSGDICIKPESPVGISKTGTAAFYFAVPAGTYHGVQITLFGDNGKKVTAKLAEGKTLTVNRANVVRLAANGITPSMEGSNCFIGEENVPIVITTMGNAFDGTTALDGNDAKAVWKPLNGNADACEVVWETVNTATSPASGTVIKSATYANGVLTVIPTGTPGNALVAVKKDGEIVWSYHIWVPETEIGRVLINNTNGKFVFLDRNLGALNAADPNVTDNTKSIGMFYQWGRKDPILGYCDFSGSIKMNSISYEVVGATSDDYYTIISNSIKNPAKLLPASSSANIYGTNLRLWGYNTVDAQPGNNGPVCAKTIYDPCPAGYRVAGDINYIALKGGNNYYLAPTSKGNNAFNVQSLSFPQIGSIDTDKNYKSTYYGVWTATSRPSGKYTAWMFQYNSTNVFVGQAASGGGDGWYLGAAFNVRCIKDEYGRYSFDSINKLEHEDINFFN